MLVDSTGNVFHAMHYDREARTVRVSRDGREPAVTLTIETLKQMGYQPTQRTQ